MKEYISEIKEFYELVTLKGLSTGQIALWQGLMYLNNKCFWEESFTVANLTLQLYTGLSRSGIAKARNELKQKGLLDFSVGKSGQATTYKLYDLSKSKQLSVQVSEQVCTHLVDKKSTSSKQVSSTLIDKDKDKDKDNITPYIPFDSPLKEKSEEWLKYKSERKQTYKNTGLKSFFAKIQKGVEDYGTDGVVRAIDTAMSNNWSGVFFNNEYTGKTDTSCFDVYKDEYNHAELEELTRRKYD